MTRLAVRQLSCRLQGRDILHNISTQVLPGELVALVGPNGAGKSTLLRAMAGIQPGVTGEVMLDGLPLPSLAPAHLARVRGYLAQVSASAWPVTVQHLVGLGRLPLRAFWQPADVSDTAAVQRAMQQTDVMHLAGRIVTTLSGGERLRVMLARVLAAEPDLVLADEPLAALDPLHQLQVMHLLRRHCDAGGSAVVALHDLAQACRFCDRLLLLDNGHAVLDAAPAEALVSGMLERVYRVRFSRVDVEGCSVPVPVAPYDPQ